MLDVNENVGNNLRDDTSATYKAVADALINKIETQNPFFHQSYIDRYEQFICQYLSKTSTELLFNIELFK